MFGELVEVVGRADRGLPAAQGSGEEGGSAEAEGFAPGGPVQEGLVEDLAGGFVQAAPARVEPVLEEPVRVEPVRVEPVREEPVREGLVQEILVDTAQAADLDRAAGSEAGLLGIVVHEERSVVQQGCSDLEAHLIAQAQSDRNPGTQDEALLTGKDWPGRSEMPGRWDSGVQGAALGRLG